MYMLYTDGDDLFSLAKVDLQSERAYELATQGLIRPSHSQPTGQAVIYSIKCVDWSLPYLTLGMIVTDSHIYVISTHASLIAVITQVFFARSHGHKELGSIRL